MTEAATATVYRTHEETRVILEKDEKTEDNKLRHIVNPPSNLHIWNPGMTAQDVVDIARVRGIEIVALCGAKFVPTKNPEDVDETCNTCLDIAGIMLNNPPEA